MYYIDEICDNHYEARAIEKDESSKYYLESDDS